MVPRNVVEFQRTIQRYIAEDRTLYDCTAYAPYALNISWQQLMLDFEMVHVASAESDASILDEIVFLTNLL
jgi:hypothetical protein